MDYVEINTQSGVLGFNIINDEAGAHASACSHRGRDVNVTVPSFVEFKGDRISVTEIDRKAFLSDKYLHEISVPDSVTQIKEWAFAGCRALERISVHRQIKVLNGAFKDCERLNCVNVRDGSDNSEALTDSGYLLAAVIRFMEAGYLFVLENAGDEGWISNWDMKMDSILNEADEEGFTSLLACGEEDYEGRDNTLDAYLARRRRRKVRLCLIRLMHDHGLGEDLRNRLISYLKDHRAGTKHPDTWSVVLDEHGDEEDYYRLLNECDCINKDNIGIMLEDMGDRHPGMKAFLLRLSSDLSDSGFFDSMDL